MFFIRIVNKIIKNIFLTMLCRTDIDKAKVISAHKHKSKFNCEIFGKKFNFELF